MVILCLPPVTDCGLSLQVDASAGAVLPGKPLAALLTVANQVSPADLTGGTGRKLRQEAEEIIKGAKVCQGSPVLRHAA